MRCPRRILIIVVAAVALFCPDPVGRAEERPDGAPPRTDPPIFPGWAHSLAWTDRTLTLSIRTGFRTATSPVLRGDKRHARLAERRFSEGVRTLIRVSRARSAPGFAVLIRQNRGSPDTMWIGDDGASTFARIPDSEHKHLTFIGPITYADLDLLLEIAGWSSRDASIQRGIGGIQLYPLAQHHGYFMATVFPETLYPGAASNPFPYSMSLRVEQATPKTLPDKVVYFGSPRVVRNVPIAGTTLVTTPATGYTAILTVERVDVNSGIPENAFPSP